jgi:hypothetical protein
VINEDRRPEYGDERDVEVRAFFERILPLNGLNYADGTLDHEYCMNGEGDSRVPVDEAL